MAELGTGYISIVAQTGGMQRDIQKAFSGLDSTASKSGEGLGRKLSSGIGKTLKAGALGAGAAVGGILATSIAKGMGRLTGIENAEAKLRGLGHEAEGVESIMTNALASVKGTSFGMEEAATTAASVVAAGVKPGQELERTLKLVGDAATIAGTDMASMGSIVNKVATADMMQMDVANQLMDAGIPILQMVGDELGVTADEARKMASEGKISFETFQNALEDGVGGAALEVGDTFEGSMKNMGAAMGRFGAKLAEPVFQSAPAVFSAVGDAFDELGEKVQPLVDQFGQWLAPKMEDLANNIGPATSAALDWIETAVTNVWGAVEPLVPSLVSLGKSFGSISANISVAVWQALGSVLNALAPLIESVLVPLVEQVAEFAEQNPGMVQKMVVAFLGFKAVGAVAGPVGKAATAVRNIGDATRIASGFFKSAGFIGGLKSIGASAKSANPIIATLGGGITKMGGILGKVGKVIGFVVTKINPWVAAITAVVGALTWFFTQTETGKNIWAGLMEKLQQAWAWLKETFTPIFEQIATAAAGAWEQLQQGWQRFTDLLQSTWENIIKPVLDVFAQIIQVVFGVIFAVVVGTAMVAWNLLSAAIQFSWENIIKPTWNNLQAVLQFLWESVIQPIFNLIGQAWNLLATAVQWYWQNVILVAWNNLQAVLQFLWESVIQPIFNFIQATWQTLSNAIMAAWVGIIKPAWDALAAALQNLWNTYISPIVQWAMDKWQAFSDKVSAVVDWIVGTAFGKFRAGLDALKSFFGTIVDGIRDVWNKLRGHLAKPINFMINTVYNDGILRAWNIIAGILPGLNEGQPLAGIPEHATGGRIVGPGTGTSDDVLMWGSNGEHMMTEREVRNAGGHAHVYGMRDALSKKRPFVFDGRGGYVVLPKTLENTAGDLWGAAPSLAPKYADGGEVKPLWQAQVMRGHEWAKAQHGKPYVWGGSIGPDGGTDCSGFMSSLADVILGGTGLMRGWATGNFPGGGTVQGATGPQGFVAGLGPGFSIGVSGVHTAGTLSPVGGFGPANVESGGANPSMVKYIHGAAGADHPQFPTHYHLPIGADGAFIPGAGGSVSPETMKNVISEKLGGAIDTIMSPILDLLPDKPPEWKGIPRGFYDKGRDGLTDFIGEAVAGLGDKLGTVFAAASGMGDIVRDAATGVWDWVTDNLTVFDTGGMLGTGQAAVNQGGPEYVLPTKVTDAFMQFLKDMPGTAGAMERAAVAMQAAAEEFELAETARKSAEDYALEQGGSILSTVGLEGLIPLGQKIGAKAWDAYQASGHNVDVRGQTVVIELNADEDSREARLLRKLEGEIDWLKVKAGRKPKAATLTKGGVM